jgi:carbon storage regulator
MIADDIEVTVLAVHGDKVRLGIDAPADVRVFRTEIYREIEDERERPGKRTDLGSGAKDLGGTTEASG